MAIDGDADERAHADLGEVQKPGMLPSHASWKLAGSGNSRLTVGKSVEYVFVNVNVSNSSL